MCQFFYNGKDLGGKGKQDAPIENSVWSWKYYYSEIENNPAKFHFLCVKWKYIANVLLKKTESEPQGICYFLFLSCLI